MKKYFIFLLFSLLSALVFGQLRGQYTHSYDGLDVTTIVFAKKHRFYYFYNGCLGYGTLGGGKYPDFFGILTLEFEDDKYAPKILEDKISTTEATGDSITLDFSTTMQYYNKTDSLYGLYISVRASKNKKEVADYTTKIKYFSDSSGRLRITLPKTNDSIYLAIKSEVVGAGAVSDKNYALFCNNNYTFDLNFYIGPYLLKKGDIYRYNIRQISPKSIALKRKGYGKSSFLHYKKYEKKKEQESQE
jgi:hypothetical protein